MASTSVLICVAVAIATAFSAPSVFLENNGSQICTLNDLGNIVKGPVTYPVYQKVCREVIPTMGKRITVEEENKPFRRADDSIDSAETVRRAIMMQGSQSSA
jgi:hypothetical protein